MKYARFKIRQEEDIYQGEITKNGIKEITGDIFGDWKFSDNEFSLDNVQFLVPIKPKHIIGIGVNYIAEEKERPQTLPEIPVFFFKPISSIIGPEEAITIPKGLNEVKFESELAVIIGKKAKNIKEEEALNYVFGYTVGNDVTSPQYFRSDGHWTVGKAFDTFTPLGPVIETDLDLSKVCVKSALNGEIKQNSSTELMIISVKKIISYLSNIMTLSPGDVILTGAPVGAEFLKEDDIIECEIEEIGKLRNSVEKL